MWQDCLGHPRNRPLVSERWNHSHQKQPLDDLTESQWLLRICGVDWSLETNLSLQRGLWKW